LFVLNGSQLISSVKDVKEVKEDFNVYPNPAKDMLNIYFNNSSHSDIKIEFADIVGKKVKEICGLSTSSLSTISLSDLKPGVYTITLSGSSFFSSKKFVKQ